MYLVHCLRPLQAWNLAVETMRDTIILCQLKSRMENDEQFREMAKRAYWACYVMDCELRSQLVLPPRVPHKIHDQMPLPSSELDEPGIFYFLSEIALRQLLENVNENIGFRGWY
ncbi:hypothetical protein DH86_00004168 [Scytalidium sp. 3C]|nr:hypothetical protein DH86_00004168 [Scytalidium sp. 3C]